MYANDSVAIANVGPSTCDGFIARMAGDLAKLVADPERCGVVVVTQAEEMPVEEALELRTALHDKVQRDPELLVVNGLYPTMPPEDPKAKENELISLWRKRRLLNDRELVRLRQAWPGPRIELPQLPLDRGPALLGVLGRCLNESARNL